MVELKTASGERIVMDAETAEYLLSPDFKATLIRKVQTEAENEVARLRATGWTQADFAHALEQELHD
jgi:hypothetical protein